MTSELGTNSRGPRTDDINRVAKLLMETWYRVDPSSTVTKEPASYVANFADMAKTMIADWNTRAVPDVPELERYRLTHDKFHCDDIMVHNENGEYVRYDQAAAVIAANRAEKHKAQNAVLNLERKLAQYLQK